MKTIIEWLIILFLKKFKLVTKIELTSQINILVDKNIDLHRQVDSLNIVIETLRHNPPREVGSDDAIYKNFGQRMNVIRAIKSPTKNCQWISIYNTESLISNPDNRDDIIKQITKYGNKKMALVDVTGRNVKEVHNIFKKTHTVNFQTNYMNSNGSDMCIIMFKLKKLYIEKWDIDNSWLTIGAFGNYGRYSDNISSHMQTPTTNNTLSNLSRKLNRGFGSNSVSNIPCDTTHNIYKQLHNETDDEYLLRTVKLKREDHINRMKSNFKPNNY
tara:strand:- start:32090 stop:32905 length:816 start_codon:yes stop_codon:yes gene_type:complete